jgi:hypothetical protein
MHTTIKGDISTLRVMAALIERGERVLRPMSEHERYDVALDRSGVLYRIQCKTGRYVKGCVLFKACSTHYHRGGRNRNYVGQIDAFGIYCPQIGKTYLVPMERMTSKSLASLRVTPQKHNNGKPILNAAEFEI